METLTPALTVYGPLGIMVLILLYAVTKLYLRNEEIQEKRISEYRENLKALHEAAESGKAQGRAIEQLGEIIKARHSRIAR